ncbi:hypothetical protein GPJ56_004404 [Histomonas meleagridis]|uniref:uncharacterized protein n=1 Tax=Histomonas meleagridis TaxID=135588 RepID=UPI00355A3F6A|nr:hypothetical protein GPJ56_004404 [Histomonas meleagridis]KAH0799952.1 hypothetical protein GO595_007064 [Histomonas meleagridis]
MKSNDEKKGNPEVKFPFYLPSSKDPTLMKDNSSHYALLTYPRDEVMIPACKIIVSYIDKDPSAIPLNSKKRIKFLMEFLAVALSMTIDDHKLMQCALDVYHEFLKDMSFFGSPQRQNKYIRRILMQLSIPFQMNHPVSQDVTKDAFYSVLSGILYCYNDIHLNYSRVFDQETWIVLINTLINILDTITVKHSATLTLILGEKHHSLKQAVANVLFSALYTSGIKEDHVWKRIGRFFSDWSNDIDFIKSWGENTIRLFNYFLHKIYNIPIDANSNPFVGGIFIKGKEIDDQSISYILVNSVSPVDGNKIHSLKGTLDQASSICETLYKIARSASKTLSKLLTNRFPAVTFLQLFGKLLYSDIKNSESPKEEFDVVISKNITTMMRIMKHFEVDNSENIYYKMITYILKFLKKEYPFCIKSFYNYLSKSFSHNYQFIPYLSEVSLLNMQNIDYSETPTDLFEPMKLLSNTFDSLISSQVILRNDKKFSDMYSSLLDPFTKFPSHYKIVLYKFICNSFELIDYPIFKQINDIFSNLENYEQIENGISFISGLINYISAIIRARPQLSKAFLEEHVLNSILDCANKVKENPHVLISVLLLLITLIEWGEDIFHQRQELEMFYPFYNKLSAYLANKESAKTYNYHLPIINLLSNIVVSRIDAHIPILDYFSRKLDSSLTINEELIIKKYAINNPVINYYTVQEKLLVSFIEKSDGTGPLVVFARGSFGKTIWIVSDNIKSTSPEPKLANDIVKTALPQPPQIDVKPIQLQGTPIEDISKVNLNELKAEDDKLLQKFGKEYQTWLEWDYFGFYPNFNQPIVAKRPKVIDFLTTIGILDSNNSLSVRLQLNKEHVLSVIKRFDELEKLNVNVIPVLHVTCEDDALLFKPAHHKRVSQLLQQFMREISEPMVVSDTAAKDHKLPPLRTTVPIIPSSNSVSALVCPSMAKAEDGAKTIFNMARESVIHIIFNETDFDLKISKDYLKSDQMVLIIKPTLNGLYHVKKLSNFKDMLTPFGEQQTMTAEGIAFGLSICGDAIVPLMSVKEFNDACNKRLELIRELCNVPIVKELSVVAATQI